MRTSLIRVGLVPALVGIMWLRAAAGEGNLPNARPVPDLQVLPLPYHQASFQYLGKELTRFHFGQSLERPFLYPVVGAAGRTYTRMGHPHDPMGHSHHNSIWIAHQNVDGTNFWEDRIGSRIVCQRMEQYEDGPAQAWLLCVNAWQDAKGKTLMLERRRIAVEILADGDWHMFIDMQLEAPAEKPVTLGKTPFGLIGVRMAKTIGVRDGGGRILNSQGQMNEKEIFRKPARWVDYSGPVTREATGGITLMDHPTNPNHPAAFHVRDDGWMGACLTLLEPRAIEPGKPLRLRYGFWVHDGVPTRDTIEPHWRRFADSELPNMQRQRR